MDRLIQGAKCDIVPKFNLEFAWGKSIVVAVTLFHLFTFLFFFLFFPPNFCALLALDTGHLWIPVIHKDAWRYLNLQEMSAGDIPTRMDEVCFPNAAILLWNCIYARLYT